MQPSLRVMVPRGSNSTRGSTSEVSGVTSDTVYLGTLPASHNFPLACPGSLGALSTVIAKNEGNITNLKIVNRTQQFWEMLIDVEVRNVKHLTNVIAALRATPAINSVERARG